MIYLCGDMRKDLNIDDFIYPLPPDRIALYPLAKRDDSKLLVFRQGKIIHTRFFSLIDHLPENSLLVFNNTKVIPARINFKKDTGAEIEIFLLHPVQPSTLLIEAMASRSPCRWQCTIGNLKRWPADKTLKKQIRDVVLEAVLVNKTAGIVEFNWKSEHTFAEIVDAAGETPLPPYLKRKPDINDRERYQTIYSQHEGAVAAPTAGLHFTPEVFESLSQKKVATDFVTLHVSAGTFQPIKTKNVAEHSMHNEQIVVKREHIQRLRKYEKCIVPIGTTSLRTLESLFWYGAKLLRDPQARFTITQNDPYDLANPLPTSAAALDAIITYMEKNQLETLIGETSIYIVPGYTFRICSGLITNFHQPGSTLMLLVAAFVNDDWKRIYHEALQNDYRFLSYGDSSLLLP